MRFNARGKRPVGKRRGELQMRQSRDVTSLERENKPNPARHKKFRGKHGLHETKKKAHYIERNLEEDPRSGSERAVRERRPSTHNLTSLKRKKYRQNRSTSWETERGENVFGNTVLWILGPGIKRDS